MYMYQHSHLPTRTPAHVCLRTRRLLGQATWENRHKVDGSRIKDFNVEQRVFLMRYPILQTLTKLSNMISKDAVFSRVMGVDIMMLMGPEKAEKYMQKNCKYEMKEQADGTKKMQCIEGTERGGEEAENNGPIFLKDEDGRDYRQATFLLKWLKNKAQNKRAAKRGKRAKSEETETDESGEPKKWFVGILQPNPTPDIARNMCCLDSTAHAKG